MSPFLLATHSLLLGMENNDFTRIEKLKLSDNKYSSVDMYLNTLLMYSSKVFV